MQSVVKIHGATYGNFFADIKVSQRESNGSVIVVWDVLIPITSTTYGLLNNYPKGQVLTLEQKNGDFFDVYFIDTDESNYIFSTHP